MLARSGHLRIGERQACQPEVVAGDDRQLHAALCRRQQQVSAWRLVKFVDNGMLTMTKCSSCGGQFVTHPHEIAKHYVCGLCNPPARAGKGRQTGALQLPSAASTRQLATTADDDA